ncbi:hypothetical protein ACJW30_10G034100 [Castanea mollissima]
MYTPSHFLLAILSFIEVAVSQVGFCSMPPSIINSDSDSKPQYWKVTNPTLSPSHLQDLPGFTRSVYKRDHALITPESQVFSPLPEWTNTLKAYLITPAIGSNFVMYLAKMQGNSKSGLPPSDVDSYAYLPPNFQHSLKCDASATLVVFERRYASLEKYVTEQIVSSTKKQPLLETPGEIFDIRKLLPTSLPYDFNIHIMDFQPGEYLNVKVLIWFLGLVIWRFGFSFYLFLLCL